MAPGSALVVRLTVGRADGDEVRWSAAAPPAQIYSFSGSGLPLPSERAAFEGGATMSGVASVAPDGTCEIALPGRPGAYHDLDEAAQHPRPPQLHVQWTAGGEPRSETADLSAEAFPHRSLRPACPGSVNRPNRPPPDYGATQERRLRAAAFGPRETHGGENPWLP